jgi:uncharacterized membrane protein
MLKKKFYRINSKSFISIRISILILFFYILIHLAKYFPFYFPVFFTQFDTSIAKELLRSVIASSAAIIGITISILVFSVNMLLPKFGDHAISTLYKNGKLKFVIALFIWAIILSIFNYIFLPVMNIPVMWTHRSCDEDPPLREQYL